MITLLLLILHLPDFDLDEIPDDRDPTEANSQPLTPPQDRMPTPQAEAQHSRRRKRRKKRKTRKDHHDSGNDEPTIALPEEGQPLGQSPPENSQLRETEPETFHIYASSDESNLEEPPKSPVGRKAQESIEDLRQEARERATLDTADHSSPSDKDEPTTPAPSPGAAELKVSPHLKLQSPGEAVMESSGTHDSDVGPQISSGFAAVNHNSQLEVELQVNTAPDLPSLIKRDGRWLCPFAEDYGCSKTFSAPKVAKRHAQTHVKRFTCAVCNKSFGRNDTLKRHMEQHDGLEIPIAEAGKENKTLQVETEVENGTQEKQDEMNEDGTVEFTTPPEISQFEVAEEECQVGLEEAEEAEEGVQEHQVDTEGAQETNPAQHVTSERPPSPDLEDGSFDIRIIETPVATQGQKRKRKVQTSDPVENTPEPRKRRKGTATSSSTLLPLSANSGTNIEAQQFTEKIIPQLQPRRQSSIEGWAQPYKPGLKLRHPILNPKPSPKRVERLVEVLIPRTSQAGPSSDGANKSSARNTMIQKQRDKDSGGGTVNAQPNSSAIRSSSYTTTNGKARAEAGIEYSSPSKTDTRRGSARKSSGMATSVAKRTFPTTPADKINGDSESDYSGDNAATSDDEISDTERTLRNIMDENFECGTCHAKLGSEKALKKHLKNPNVHLLKCRTCSKKFVSMSALERHETESGHGKDHDSKGNGKVGQVGAFSNYEVQKLNNWKDKFCEEHNITGAQFNDMMTDTLQRGRSGTWNWVFINRTDFMDQYLSVLPNRNRTSMLRYRERNFQNVEGSLNWTDEDDMELIRLVKEMGTKWSKIAKVMLRTQDAVSQRWRHKLRHTKAESGEWSRAENSKLNKALAEIRRQSGVTADDKEWAIPWVQVSERVKTRTPQQCSNHWRALHSMRKDGKWVSVSGLEKTPGASRVLTPSKMQKHLTGASQSPGKRSKLSSKFVQDDGTDQENELEDQSIAAKVEERLSNPTGIESNSEMLDNETTRTPHISRELLTKKTPGKTLGSSQLFAQTQVNTSALKPPPSNSKQPTSSQAQTQSQSQDRPSPNISIQRRAISRSPLQEITPIQDVELDRAENDSTEGVESGDDINQDVEIRETEIEKTDAEDEVMVDGSDIESSGPEDEAMTDESTTEDETSSEGEESDIGEKHETGPLLDDEAEETSEEDSDDGEEDSDENAKDDSEEEQQGSVNDETFDFMDSINEAAQRVKSSQVKLTNGRALGPRKRTKPLEDESEDEETESE